MNFQKLLLMTIIINLIGYMEPKLSSTKPSTILDMHTFDEKNQINVVCNISASTNVTQNKKLENEDINKSSKDEISAKITDWNAEIQFEIKRQKSRNKIKIHDDTSIYAQCEERTFSNGLQNYLTFHKLPLRSNATIGGVILQDLDHFNVSEKRKWKQFFFYNTNYYNESEINFLHLGGEGPIYESEVLENSSMMMIWAKAFGANAYALEHRFYGDSQPTGKQALADAAVFIKSINLKNKFLKPKWIVFGGSYPGNLAAWLRLKFPQLAHGAVASSAPVEAKLNNFEYFQVVQKSIENYGSKHCLQNVKKFVSKAQKLLHTTEGQKKLGICKTDTFEESDKKFFFETYFAYLGQSVQDDNIDHGKVAGLCQSSKRLTDKLFANKKTYDHNCKSYSYKTYVQLLQNTNPTWYRAWMWQACTEFGYFQSTDAFELEYTVLSHSYYVDMCKDVFDIHNRTIEQFINNTNQVYGGKKFDETNTIFVNGSEDPWHLLSIYNASVPTKTKATFITGTSHCRDMFPPHRSDSKYLISARNIVRENIVSWLSQ